MDISRFAKIVGVSTATVSRAFSGKGRISPATRATILQRARELGYRPNRMAAGMKRQHYGAISFLYEATGYLDSDYYLAEMSVGVSTAAARADQVLQIVTVPRDATLATKRLEDTLYAGGIDGFIVYLDAPWSKDLQAAAENRGLPYMILDNTRAPGDAVLSIGAEIEAASRKVGGYFERLGRRAPAFISGTHDVRKLTGYREGLGASAAALRLQTGGATFADGYAAARELLTNHPATDAIFCANDVLAVGAIRAATDMGLRIPEQLAIIGCDDLKMAQFQCPALSTIRLPKQALGELAVARLLSRITGSDEPPRPDYECELIIRESA